MSNEYLKTFRVGSVDCLKLGDIEETSAVISFLKRETQHVVPSTTFSTSTDLNGVFYELSTEYSSGYYLTCINSYLGDEGEASDVSSPPSDMSTWGVPYNGDDSYTFIITDVPLHQLAQNPELIITSFIKAFGVRFIRGEQPPPPEGDEWVGGRTFVTIRDNMTLEELGKSYDLMNTKIYEEINNKYTLDFNILPYENVNKIMHPNFLEINSDYFRIRSVEKRRTNSLMMSISCEHISYELNVPYELAVESGVNMNEEMTLRGTPTEILETILADSRFSVGTVHFSNHVEFTFKLKGFRSLIIEFANFIGAEVKWDKFTVSLLIRRGADRDLTFEVGKNLLSMTEVYETQSNGSLVRSYDVDVIDLSLIENDGVQEEIYDIRLGDTVFLVDEQFAINVNRRVVSYEIDPFRRELPRIQLGRVGKNITNVINDAQPMQISSGGAVVEEILMRFKNNRDHTFNTSDNTDIDLFMDLIENPLDTESWKIKVIADTVVTCGIAITGTSTMPSVFNIYLTVDRMRVTPTFCQTITGKATISIPISFALARGDNQSVEIIASVDSGDFEVLEGSAHMYLKGKYITYQQMMDQN